MKRIYCIVLTFAFGIAVLVPAQPAGAQGKGFGGGKGDVGTAFTRANPAFVKAFRDSVATSAKSTVRVLAEDKEAALGFIVDSSGLILTKLNDLKGSITVKVNGKLYDAKVVAAHKQHDLALLKIELTGLTPVLFADSKTMPVGSWVACPGPGDDPVAVGVISVATRDLPNGGGPILTANANAGYLGVQFDTDFAGIRILAVMPKTPAEKIGLKKGDIVLALQMKPVAAIEEFQGLMLEHKSGDTVTLKIKRGDEELEFKPTLDKRPANRGDIQNNMGSKLSSRRTGYPTILQHDSVLLPEDCGGPLVDLAGRVLGINVCRAGRVESWTVPTEVIRPLLVDMKAGKLAPTAGLFKDPPTPAEKLALTEEKLKKSESDIKELRDALKKAEADRIKLDETIKKVQADIGAKDKTLGDLRDLLKDLRDKAAKPAPASEKKDAAPAAPPPAPKSGAWLDRSPQLWVVRDSLRPSHQRSD
jgi:serine protease Do